jgi:hypothetical protein
MSGVSRRSAGRARIVPALVSSADVSTRRRWTLAGGALLMCGAAACEQSRGDPDAEPPAATVVVNLPPSTAEPDTSEATVAPDTSAAGGATNEPSLNVPFADYFDVDPFGAEPVRGSGCGLDTPIGDELPDGLWRGYVRSFDGLWVDAATSLEFDVACVYAGSEDRRDDQLVEESVEVPDGYLVNNNDRVRTVRLGASFVQVDAQWNDDGQCVPPETLPPSGETQRYVLLDSWLLVVDGEARWAVTSCLPR